MVPGVSVMGARVLLNVVLVRVLDASVTSVLVVATVPALKIVVRVVRNRHVQFAVSEYYN